MFENIKEFLHNFFKSRLFVLAAVMIILFAVLLQRLFTLQIINGEEYLDNYTLKIKKEKVLSSTRGNIYDRNGELLAYNELAYSVTIEDNGSYDSTKEKNETINSELENILAILDKNGDQIQNTFNISLSDDGSYAFTVEGKTLSRFLADIYGRATIDELKYNKKLGYNEGEATADQVMEYLCSESNYNLSEDEYSKTDVYRIAVIRYAMSQNSYQKYISTTIATDVSDNTVAYVSENGTNLQGVEIEEDTVRKYVDSEYFAHIIGYTGKISEDEYSSLSEKSDNYSLTDVVGKSGIEQVMDLALQGTKGYETVYVDNLGKVVETTDTVDPTAGNDVYLSIDKNIQEAVYNLLEQEIAGIIYSKIQNTKEYSASENSTASDIMIPIYDVYYALINNNVINTDHFTADDASQTEQTVYSIYQNKQASVLSSVQSELTSNNPTAYKDLPEETQVYMTYIATMLSSNGILISDNIDSSDEVYTAWKNNNISLEEYLNHAIENSWIDITQFSVDEKYSDSSEIYSALVTYIMDELSTDKGFSKKIYKYMISQDLISGTQLCLILYDQNILTYDEGQVAGLASGSISSFDFLKSKIQDLEITPAQLALDPCTGSCVVTDTKTGELLACVTYPGYDNNKLANTVDADYYASLQTDLSLPLYDYATQQRTAPGSTFKMVTATAGLTEGVISTQEQILDEGQFMKVTPSPKCWIYPSNHGLINVSEAIRDSCNYFFYEVGYRLSCNGDVYNADKGIATIQKYAQLYGLGDTTGIEIAENSPQIADEYPITAAIGQSNNNYTTTELSRYVTAVANSGTVYNYTLLDKVTDSSGNVIEEYTPTVKNTIDEVSDSSWDAIHSGMQMVTQSLEAFNNFPISVAGKTGTAQQVTTRPNHALFVGYAPYEDPQISIATRIAYGYTSHNSAAVSAKILEYVFGLADEETLLNGQAADVGETTNSFND